MAGPASSNDDPERQPLLGRVLFRHGLTDSPPTRPHPPLPLYSCISNPLNDLPVYTTIHRIRRDIVSVVEDYLSPEQLRDVRLNIAVIRPLVDKLYGLDDISVVYCLLVNRVQFLLEQAPHGNRHNVSFTRAVLCELIATRILRRFSDRQDGPDGLLLLAHILVAGFEPFQNAPEDVRQEARLNTSWISHKTQPALEVAILTESKLFLSSTPCKKIIKAIYDGRIVYTPSSFLDLIPDHYKQKPISLYDPRDAPILNQYRLMVPRTRNLLEIIHFIILLVLYLLVMTTRNPSEYQFYLIEIAFSIYAFGWVLDQLSTILAHGWHVYTQNLWSFLDVSFTAIYLAYLVLRIHGWQSGSIGMEKQALDVLALGALVLIPRPAFNLLSDNIVFLSLRSMMADFSLLVALCAWLFFGFLLSLLWLGDGKHLPLTISKWMLWIWFGLDGTGIQRSAEFHWLLGPSVMIMFTFLGNTLFLTILVSMLSNTFSNIAANADAEISFRRAVQTLEGVKSDALFAYSPPFNIVAVFVFFPLKFVLSPRWFHKIHVATVRLINLPLLVIIAIAERRLLWGGPHPNAPGGMTAGFTDAENTAVASTSSRVSTPPSSLRQRPTNRTSKLQGYHDDGWWWWPWSGFRFWRRWSSDRDIRAVFDLPPPEEVHAEIAVDDELTHHLIRRQFTRINTGEAFPRPAQTNERWSHSASDPPSGTSGTSGAQQQTAKSHIPNRRDSIFPGIAPSKLRESFCEDDDNGEVRDRLAGLEQAVERMEGMLLRLLGEAGAGPDSSRPVGLDEANDDRDVAVFSDVTSPDKDDGALSSDIAFGLLGPRLSTQSPRPSRDSRERESQLSKTQSRRCWSPVAASNASILSDDSAQVQTDESTTGNPEHEE